MPATSVMTAVAHPSVEARVTGLLGELGDEVTVVRRCVDVPDMLAVVASGAVRIVLLSVDLPGLERDVVTQLRVMGAEPVAIDDDLAPGRAFGLGITVLLPPAADAGQLRAVLGAAGDVRRAAVGYADPSATVRDPAAGAPRPLPPGPRGGRLVAVWGPTGAPGRSTVALTLADEAARLGVPTLLVDADVYGGAIAPMLGLLDEAPGTAAACRLAGQGGLDSRGLARVALTVGPNLRVLTGISRVDRWPELRASALESVLQTARLLCPFVVVDCGFGIEQDEELAYDTVAPRRNAATLVALESADEVVVVSGADPVSVARAIRAIQDLTEAMPGLRLRLAVNRVRSGVFEGAPSGQLSEAFERFVGLPVGLQVPDDRAATDRALLRGRPVGEVAPKSAIRAPLIELAAGLTGATVRSGRRSAPRR